MNAYPIKFVPIVKDKIWGGQKLHTLLGKDFGTLPNGGESWELSAVEGNVSVIANGEYAGLSLVDATAKFGASLIGKSVYERFGTKFPLLIKFIDANDNLSVQVHPNDAMAKAKHNSFGKTEMWYVLAAEPGAKLISGFARQITADDYKPLLERGEFMQCLGAHEVKRGDVLFMPAGRIHAIGKGVMVAEIQQTSDITYRVYDYDRKDANGKGRELHVDEARDALDFSDTGSGMVDYELRKNARVDVVRCPYFETGVVAVDGVCERDYSAVENCVILMCVKGRVEVDGVELRNGETALIPACVEKIKMTGEESEVLEVYIP